MTVLEPGGRQARPGVLVWGADDLRDRVDEALQVYVTAMDYPQRVASERRPYVLRHLLEPGLRAVAVLEHGDRGALVGFGYGYLGRSGQWWHDEVARGLAATSRLRGPGSAIDRWLGSCFEVCELHVRPADQGAGHGRALLRALLAGTSARTAVLSTPDVDSRARRLYRAEGFVDLLTGFRFAGDLRDFAVLGRELAP